MSVDPKLPERPGGEPIVIVAIEDHGSIVINTGSSKEVFKFVFGDNVSKHRVTKLAIPRPSYCTQYVTLIIGFRVYIDRQWQCQGRSYAHRPMGLKLAFQGVHNQPYKNPPFSKDFTFVVIKNESPISQDPFFRFATSNDCGWTPSSAEQKSQPTLARQSQEPLALNSPRHFPLRRTSCVPPVWPQIPLEAFFNDGGGSLQRHEYHMEKSCQDEFRGYFASGLIERRLIKSQRVCVLAR